MQSFLITWQLSFNEKKFEKITYLNDLIFDI